jgi:nucleoside triphosphate pyrophosphatase
VTIPFHRSIYLASRSPRRRELLAQFGVPFHLLMFRTRADASPELSEDVQPGESPADYVLRVAREKAVSGWSRMLQRRLPPAPVLAADTTVALDGRILGKPADRGDAAEILAALAGKRHEVLTAVALKYEERLETALSASEVLFREISPQELRDYVASGECDDKAGAYAIQGRAAMFVREIRGSHSGIVGLPLYETAQLLQALGPLHDRRNPD